jgi:hypothetical protein
MSELEKRSCYFRIRTISSLSVSSHILFTPNVIFGFAFQFRCCDVASAKATSVTTDQQQRKQSNQSINLRAHAPKPPTLADPLTSSNQFIHSFPTTPPPTQLVLSSVVRSSGFLYAYIPTSRNVLLCHHDRNNAPTKTLESANSAAKEVTVLVVVAWLTRCAEYLRWLRDGPCHILAQRRGNHSGTHHNIRFVVVAVDATWHRHRPVVMARRLRTSAVDNAKLDRMACFLIRHVLPRGDFPLGIGASPHLLHLLSRCRQLGIGSSGGRARRAVLHCCGDGRAQQSVTAITRARERIERRFLRCSNIVARSCFT